MKWTFVQVNRINDTVGWQVPDVLLDGNIRYFEDALTALQFAEYKCAQYNKHHPKTRKVAVINSQLHFQKVAEVQVGPKAMTRLGLDNNDENRMPIRNIFVFYKPELSLGTGYRAFGQIVRNGETQSVMNRDPLTSTLVPNNMRWTNLSVLEMKAKYGFPENIFFPTEERRSNDFLSMQNPMTKTQSLFGKKSLQDFVGSVTNTRWDTEYTPTVSPAEFNRLHMYDFQVDNLEPIPPAFGIHYGRSPINNEVYPPQNENDLIDRQLNVPFESVIRPILTDEALEELRRRIRTWGNFQISGTMTGHVDMTNVVSSNPVQHSVDVSENGEILLFRPLFTEDTETDE